jgi:hypothetical protein
MCVQRFDDSRNSAIHTTYRISLRSSSMREPRDPLLKVLTFRVLQFRRKAIEMARVYGVKPPVPAPHSRRYSEPQDREAHLCGVCGTEATGKILRWV